MNKVEKEVNRLKARLARWILKVVYRISTYDGSDSKPSGSDSTVVPEPETKPTEPETQSETIKIVSFGSPNTSKAKEEAAAQIKDLKLNKDGLSYKWAKGGCEQLGATSASDYDHTIAVAGYSDDGKTFRCAKFDWISTSRKTRNFRNIYEHYNGFDPDKFFGAKKRCFFIMGIDGKRRTNILTD